MVPHHIVHSPAKQYMTVAQAKAELRAVGIPESFLEHVPKLSKRPSAKLARTTGPASSLTATLIKIEADKPNRSGHAGQTHGKARQIQVARHLLGPSTAPTSTPRRTGRHPPHIIVGERFNSVGPRAPPDRQLERPLPAPASSLAAARARHPAPAHPRRHHPQHRGRGPVCWWRLRRGGGLRICAREVGAREDVGDLQLFSRRPVRLRGRPRTERQHSRRKWLSARSNARLTGGYG
jgi:hypothetical protein